MARPAPLVVDLPVFEGGPQPAYQRLASRLRDLVLDGHLPSGSRLPAARVLARDVGVSRTTVEEAYARLVDEGFVARRQGSGTFVAEIDVDRPRALPYDLEAGTPTPPALSEWAQAWATPTEAPWVVCSSPCRADEASVPLDEWRRTTARVLRDGADELLQPPPPAGLPALRRAIADHVAAFRGLRCRPEHVVVTTGTQQALTVLSRVLLERGDAVWAEDPGYAFARAAFEGVGARVEAVSVDDEGLDLEAALEAEPYARLAYVTPSHQFPTGVVMSVDRRLALLRWAETAGAWIIEDDYDSEYRHVGRPLAPLQSIDRDGRVVYVGTFNKSLFPGLRVGYAVVPDALAAPFAQAVRLLGGGPPVVAQACVSAFIAQGSLASHLRRTRRTYRERCAALAHALEDAAIPDLEVGPTDAGLHVCAWLPSGLEDAAVALEVATSRVGVTALSSHYAAFDPDRHRGGLVIGYGRADRSDVLEVVERIAAACAAQLRDRD